MKYFLIIIATFGIFFSPVVMAQEKEVDYKGEVIVDSDLDGLTDKGEQQIFNTNPSKQDSDDDGYLDGVEVLSETKPMDADDYPTHRVENVIDMQSVQAETPWAWYIARAAGILGFIFLWLTIFLGLAIRNPWLKKIIAPIYSFDFHSFMAALAVFWSLVHGIGLLFDPVIGFGVKDIFIPFFNRTEIVHSNPLALGIMAFWMLVVMTITSYLRSHMSHWLWRALHFLNPLAFIFVVIHGYNIGTDIKNIYIGGVFLFSSAILALIYFSNLASMIIDKIRQRQQYKGSTFEE